jgi:predicted nucleic acid-binding protein
MNYIFLDANILVSVLNNEYPQFTYTARVLSLADHPSYRVYTSPLCLAIAFYFAEKNHGKALALKKVKLICDKILVTAVDESVVEKTLAEKKVHDFEDGLEYFSALKSNCKFIITQDKNDFYFAKIPVMNAQEYLETYVLKRKK